MKLQTQIPLIKSDNPIDYSSQLLLLGSCFSDNMGQKMEYFKFQNIQNPFGILFHPLAIEKLTSRAIHKEFYTEEEVFFLNERWHCYDAHSELSHASKEKLLGKLNSGLAQTRGQLLKASHIVITFGTAWVYQQKDTETIVANCHKVPQNQFSKELLSIDAIQKSIEIAIKDVQSINKNAQFIFTVSPVRHLKDGFVENQRSKAHLTTAIHQVISPQTQLTGLSYFESYELMIDELRDYRFYARDMVHPNALAIDYIWERFQEVWMTDEAKETMKKVGEIQRGLQHRPFEPNSLGHRKFQESLLEKIAYIKKAFPFMEFGL